MSRAVLRAGQGTLVLLASGFVIALAAGPALAQPTGSVQAINVTATTATFSGTVTDSSAIEPNSEYFQYQQMLNSDGTSPKVYVPGAPSNPSVQVTGLWPNEPYTVTLYATESGASSPSEVSSVQFKTAPAPPPTAVTGGDTAAVSPSCNPTNPSSDITLAGSATVNDANPSDQYTAQWELQYRLDHSASSGPDTPRSQRLSTGVTQLTGRVVGAAAGTYEYRLIVMVTVPPTATNPSGYTEVDGAWHTIVIRDSCGANGGSGSGGSVPAALSQSLGVSGAAAKISSILRAGGYAASAAAPGPGTLTITWDYAPAGAHIASARPIVVASGTEQFGKAGKAKLKLRLTSRGRTLLKKSKKLRLTAVGTFKPKTGHAVSKRKNITLAG